MKINHFCPPQETRGEKNKLYSKQVGKKEIIRIRADINEMEDRKSVENISETQRWFFEKIIKLMSLQLD